jgi:hypothetical protein
MLMRGKRRSAGVIHGLLRGAVAGAAGTAALNATTYLDMIIRARAPSRVPEQSIEALVARAQVPIPGEGSRRSNRVSGLGGLAGTGAGVAVGALVGVIRSFGWRPGRMGGALGTTAVAMLASNAPMNALGTTEIRRWTAQDWLSDLAPHVAYGLLASYVLDELE